MQMRYGISVVAFSALLGVSAAMAQQNNAPTDPTAPSGVGCTGFPGDSSACTEAQPNTTIPEDPAPPEVTTPSGMPDVQDLPDVDDQDQMRSGGASGNDKTPTAP